MFPLQAASHLCLDLRRLDVRRVLAAPMTAWQRRRRRAYLRHAQNQRARRNRLARRITDRLLGQRTVRVRLPQRFVVQAGDALRPQRIEAEWVELPLTVVDTWENG